MSEQPQRPQQQLNIVVPEEVKYGTYANLMVTSHTAHEFTLDFCQLLPGRESGKVQAEVVSRVRVAPTVVAKLVQTLTSNLDNYEQRFGPVKAIG